MLKKFYLFIKEEQYPKMVSYLAGEDIQILSAERQKEKMQIEIFTTQYKYLKAISTIDF